MTFLSTGNLPELKLHPLALILTGPLDWDFSFGFLSATRIATPLGIAITWQIVGVCLLGRGRG